MQKLKKNGLKYKSKLLRKKQKKKKKKNAPNQKQNIFNRFLIIVLQTKMEISVLTYISLFGFYRYIGDISMDIFT